MDLPMQQKYLLMENTLRTLEEMDFALVLQQVQLPIIKSLGGAVIHPQMDLYQITEIAALNNLVYRTLGNSIILSKEDELIIKPLKLDNHRYKC